MNINDAIYHIKYNPFKYSEYIYIFYNNINNHTDNILLLPLIIPLCSHHLYQEKLKNCNNKSSIFSVFSDKKSLHDLQGRVDDLKAISLQSFQYCLINEWLNIDTNKLTVLSNNINTQLFDRNTKIAEKLAMLFSKQSIVEIYSYLGVKP